MNWKDWLQNFDENLFIHIHDIGTSEYLDPFMLLLRNALTWVPLYLFVLIYLIKYRRNKALFFLIGTLITFAIADYGSASILKPLFQRVRPCYNEDLEGHLRHIIGCGGRYGFPSSHASNHFALAAFWFWSFRYMGIRNWYWVWVWAFMIGYAQVYVGKHYPLDILGGAIFGLITGFLISRLFIWWNESGISFRKHPHPDALS
ncbi:phosphatase PAP2 family protein [Chitinophaga niabensis]|uniref:phosphatase PAP2 family protein n=1 Tax=Chitinophaga niabensis TaxID=536979 RepID=UPI0031BA84C1